MGLLRADVSHDERAPSGAMRHVVQRLCHRSIAQSDPCCK